MNVRVNRNEKKQQDNNNNEIRMKYTKIWARTRPKKRDGYVMVLCELHSTGARAFNKTVRLKFLYLI